MSSTPRPTSFRATEFEECGLCGHYHKLTYAGDCRNDAERFDFRQLESILGSDAFWTDTATGLVYVDVAESAEA
jgi:hypothetical protein